MDSSYFTLPPNPSSSKVEASIQQTTEQPQKLLSKAKSFHMSSGSLQWRPFCEMQNNVSSRSCQGELWLSSTYPDRAFGQGSFPRKINPTPFLPLAVFWQRKSRNSVAFSRSHERQGIKRCRSTTQSGIPLRTRCLCTSGCRTQRVHCRTYLLLSVLG